MAEQDVLRRKAKADLTIQLEQGRTDLFLWEHAERCARLALAIVDLIGETGEGLDRGGLFAASLYHESGWAVQYAEGAITRWEIMSRPLSDLQRELGAGRAEESLRSVLTAKRLQTACTAIRQAGQRRTGNVMAQVLAEACSLDQIGPLAVWQMIRKNTTEGRSVADMLKAWQRQREYSYWQARIRDSLRFEPVKRIAERRLQALESFMRAVAAHAAADDFEELPAQLASWGSSGAGT